MENKKIKWCLSAKDGIRLVEPSNRLSDSYMAEARASLHRAYKDFSDGDFLWATVVLYYAEYYALYSFLQKLGVKCENYACSIIVAAFLLGDGRIAKIDFHKSKRIDAQYYMRVGASEAVSKMLSEAKLFIAEFDNIISSLTEADIANYNGKLSAVYAH